MTEVKSAKCAGCAVEEVVVIFGLCGGVESTKGFCRDCGEKKIPRAAPCGVCGNPSARERYWTIEFTGADSPFGRVPMAIIPICSSACRMKSAKMIKGISIACSACGVAAAEPVMCEVCDAKAYCSTLCMEKDEHKKVCTRPDRPCEIALAVKDKYAVFKTRHVVPDHITARGLLAQRPPPPPGTEWKILFERVPSAEMEFDALLDIARGVPEHGKNFQLAIKNGDAMAVIPGHFGTLDLATAWAKHLSPNRNGKFVQQRAVAPATATATVAAAAAAPPAATQQRHQQRHQQRQRRPAS